jgi:sterol desaturase/sphingolipid hydroxylase (fatty acid hydroxylase superfamily)
MDAFRKFVAITIFPATLSAAVLCFYYLQLQNIEPGTALISTILLAVVLIIVLEQVTPEQADWNRSHSDITADIGHTVIVFGVGGPFFALMVLAGGFLSDYLTMWLGFTLWPTTWWLPFQVVLTLLFAEFGPYWVHRLVHHMPLWRFHAVHHSAPRMYWLNTYRFHIIDLLLISVLRFLVPIALGVTVEAFLYFLVIAYVIAFFQHSNVRIIAGPLNWFFSTPDLHRWHHSAIPAESNTNFGQTIIIWDVVFGTRLAEAYLPDKLGIETPSNFPKGFWSQLIVPFRRNF